MIIKVNCTREHLKKAMYCSLIPDKFFHRVEKTSYLDFVETESNCWIAVALHDIFPFCDVSDCVSNATRQHLIEFPDKRLWTLVLPDIAQRMIAKFDSYASKKVVEYTIDGDVVKIPRNLTLEEKEDSAKNRMTELEPFSFDIEIDSYSLDLILEYNDFNLKEIKEIIEKAPHLEIVK
jgi:hypothetical protein